MGQIDYLGNIILLRTEGLTSFTKVFKVSMVSAGLKELDSVDVIYALKYTKN